MIKLYYGVFNTDNMYKLCGVIIYKIENASGSS